MFSELTNMFPRNNFLVDATWIIYNSLYEKSFENHHTLPKWELSQINPFKVHNTLPKCKWSNISPFKSITPSKNELSKITAFRITTSSQSDNYQKSVFLGPLNSPKVEIYTKKKSLQDKHTTLRDWLPGDLDNGLCRTIYE